MEDLYDIVAQAETKAFKDPWIRTTKAPKGGSTAFGPVQITKKKAVDYATRGLISKESAQFLNDVLVPMYDQFIKYGKEPKKGGYMPEYDYGGTGFFPEDQRENYRKLADEMLYYDYTMSKGDIDKFIQSWRGTLDDERWNKIIRDWAERSVSK